MKINTDDFPQLKALCWNRPAGAILDSEDALGLYESNWRFVDREALSEEEQALIDLLIAMHGNGVFLGTS